MHHWDNYTLNPNLWFDQFGQAPKVHLFAHSMGAYLIQHGFKHYSGSMPSGKKIETISFASADADQNSMRMNTSTAKQLEKFGRRFTNYASMKDEILTISKTFPNGGEERLGRGGMPSNAFASHKGLSCQALYIKELPQFDDAEDFISHRWWFHSPGFLKDYALTLANKDGLAEGTRQIDAQGQLILSVP
mgnify:CR=1 FL=1